MSRVRGHWLQIGHRMAEIQLKRVTKRWGDFVGVQEFDLEIADREFLVLLGPSGCGKTTTMRMIAGLEDPTSGDILIDGKRVNDLDPKDRDVAMVFQSYGLYPNMNVWENIRFPLKVRKVPEAEHEERVKRASAMVELDDFLHRKPAALSGGQRQRVALARAIVRTPKVFVMKQGIVQQVGTPTDIYDSPANTFVAGFIGNPAMNLIDGEVVDGTFHAGGVEIPGIAGVKGGVTLGFRAEDARVAEDGQGNIQAPVYSMELLGDSTMVTVRAGGALIAVKAAKDYRTEIKAPFGAHVPASICHLFHAKSGERLV